MMMGFDEYEIADMDEDVEVNLEEARAKAYNLDLQHLKKVLSMQDIDEEEPSKVKELLEVVTVAKLIIEEKKGCCHSKPWETATSVIVHIEVQPKDKGKGILIEEPKPFKGQAQIEQDKAFARQLEAEFNANINWNDVIEQVKRSERQGESLEHEIAKKQRMDEEAEELKRHLQIMANDDDDVYTEATPLASKNFDREDLETLWKLIKESFETTKPKNFLGDLLLNILKIMFEKPIIEANMFLLVEKKYPLTHFTIQQMLNNVRLEVKEESEMSLELLRLETRQLNEAHVPE
uniref:Uncharacterized protein n=1 Tax=Tanacetum cinerariifolium TaxID=118510 RepID=A0A699IZR8_TANCI|nr:hypothetical protein [Tanacetum cinerariifolium]